ncbi:hypothetical protein ACWGJQ_23295 [Peribacillus simplex]
MNCRYSIRKQQKVKNNLSIGMIKRNPSFQQPIYLLCDSWFTSRSNIGAALSKGIHVIGALKTNRILYPQGIGLQAKEFATHIQEDETDLVTVVNESHPIYRYEGALNDLNHGIVMMCWNEEHPMEPMRFLKHRYGTDDGTNSLELQSAMEH